MIAIILTILFSSVKFAMTFPLAIFQFQFGFFETLVWTNMGGILGIYFFAFVAGKLIQWWRSTFRKKPSPEKRNKPLFSKRNRRIVRIKNQYGLIGIAFTTPFLLSIPVGSLLVVRYYPKSRWRFPFLVSSNLIWSVIYTGFYMFWNQLLIRSG